MTTMTEKNLAIYERECGYIKTANEVMEQIAATFKDELDLVESLACQDEITKKLKQLHKSGITTKAPVSLSIHYKGTELHIELAWSESELRYFYVSHMVVI